MTFNRHAFGVRISFVQVRELEAAHTTAAEQRDRAVAAQAAAESEVAGLQQAMQRAATRHFEQLAAERAEARRRHEITAEGHWGAAPGTPAEPAYLARLRRQMEGLLQETRSSSSDNGAGQWQLEVVRKLQDMMLSAEAERSHAVTTARIATEDLAASTARLNAAQQAHERALQAADAASAQLTVHKETCRQTADQSMRHAGERANMQSRRIAALTEQLAQSNAQLCSSAAELETAKAAEREANQTISELSTSLKHVQGEVDALTAQRDGLEMEMAGTADGCGCKRKAAVEARDAAIKDYVSSRILPLLQYGCDVPLSFKLTIDKKDTVQADLINDCLRGL